MSCVKFLIVAILVLAVTACANGQRTKLAPLAPMDLLVGTNAVGPERASAHECSGIGGSRVEVKSESILFVSKDLMPIAEHYCFAKGEALEECLEDTSALPAYCGLDAENKIRSKELGLTMQWGTVRVDGQMVPILGSTFFKDEGSEGLRLDKVMCDLTQKSSFVDPVESREGASDIKRLIQDLLDQGPVLCDEEQWRPVGFLERVGDAALVRLGVSACVLEDGIAYQRVIARNENGMNEIIQNTRINRYIKGHGWVFSPSETDEASTTWRQYPLELGLQTSRTTQEYIAKTDAYSIADSENRGGVLALGDLHALAVKPDPLTPSTSTMMSAFTQASSFTNLVRQSVFFDNTSQPASFPWVMFSMHLKEPAGFEHTRVCFQADNECRNPPSILIGLPQGSGRYKHNDGTTVVHEVAHVLVRDLRSERFSALLDLPDRSATLEVLDDLADSFAQTYTLDSCIGRWATDGACVRKIDSGDIVGRYTGASSHDNGEIAANMLSIAMKKSIEECEAVGFAGHFDRLSRAAMLAEPVVLDSNQYETKKLRLKRVLSGVLKAYIDGMRGGAENPLAGEILCEWKEKAGFCPFGFDCSC